MKNNWHHKEPITDQNGMLCGYSLSKFEKLMTQFGLIGILILAITYKKRKI